MINDELLSKTINCLRFPLIVGIVFLHNHMETVNIQGHIIKFDTWPWMSLIMKLFSDVLAAVCVPLFFFISGFLFFYRTRFTHETYMQKIKRRYHTLFVPYVIWNFIGFIILLIELHPYLSSLFPLLNRYQVNIETFLSYFWIAELPVSMNGPSNPIDTPLWFVRDLMVLGILAPLVYWLIRRTGIFVIILLGAIWFFRLGKDFGLPSLSHQSVFFFPLGAYFSINRINIATAANKVRYLFITYIAWIIADLCTGVQPYGEWVHKAGIMVGMVTMIQVSAAVVERSKAEKCISLGRTSFFIFALHNLFIGKLMKVIVMVVRPQSPLLVLSIYFFVPVVTILTYIYLYKMLNKYLPHVADVVTGGR